ncbi:MAG: hypothetical protein ACRDF6_13665, partial [bacterium]
MTFPKSPAVSPLLALAATFAFAAPAARAQSSTPARQPTVLGSAGPGPSQRLDGIAAVVNEDVVLHSDIEEQLFLFLSRSRV